jgi:4a-hydroxytetrahydrobiopterin dehydratase
MLEKKSLTQDELQVKIKELVPDWKAGESERGVPYIERVKHASTYMEGIDFVAKVAETAEANNHHPDIHINYKRISVKYWTHSSGGVTLADIKMAQKITPLF